MKKKNYTQPDIEKVAITTSEDIMACSICDHPGNHYGHHKHDSDNEDYGE